MITYTGADLEAILASSGVNKYQKRDCFTQLQQYVESPNNRRILALFGLRRTGKTVLMFQMMRELSAQETILIRAEEGDGLGMIHPMLQEHKDYKYIFIDEATKFDNFVNTASVLADHYATLGKKVIIAGTDSLGIALAMQDELYDRAQVVHTTYIPFKEYHCLLGRNLDEYMRYGGTLTDGDTFYNADTSNEYINASIAHNIEHGLAQVGRDGEFGLLRRYYESGEFVTFLQKVIELDNRSFLYQTINKAFKSHDFGSLRDIATKHPEEVQEDIQLLKSPDLLREIRKTLEIRDPLMVHATEATIEQAKDYLSLADVIYRVPKQNEEDKEEVIFTQPGLRYAQMTKEIELFASSAVLQQFSPASREFLAQKLKEDIKGRMLENILFYQLAKDKSVTDSYIVQKYKANGHEADICLIPKEKRGAFLFEVKHTTTPVLEQARHLLDKTFVHQFENQFGKKVVGKAVIYRGKSHCGKKGIYFANAEDMLLNTAKMLKNIRDCSWFIK